MGHLFLQLLAIAGHDCLSSGLLLGDLLNNWLLGSLFTLILYEGVAVMYCLLPGV